MRHGNLLPAWPVHADAPSTKAERLGGHLLSLGNSTLTMVSKINKMAFCENSNPFMNFFS